MSQTVGTGAQEDGRPVTGDLVCLDDGDAGYSCWPLFNATRIQDASCASVYGHDLAVVIGMDACRRRLALIITSATGIGWIVRGLLCCP